jgi:predicted membrane channel-forming protein YqfA (hemolysin III family)
MRKRTHSPSRSKTPAPSRRNVQPAEVPTAPPSPPPPPPRDAADTPASADLPRQRAVWRTNTTTFDRLRQSPHFSFLADNEAIQTGYRYGLTVPQAFASLFALHNETMNVWSHLLGAVTFFCLTLHLLAGGIPSTGAATASPSSSLGLSAWYAEPLSPVAVLGGAVAAGWCPSGDGAQCVLPRAPWAVAHGRHTAALLRAAAVDVRAAQCLACPVRPGALVHHAWSWDAQQQASSAADRVRYNLLHSLPVDCPEVGGQGACWIETHVPTAREGRAGRGSTGAAANATVALLTHAATLATASASQHQPQQREPQQQQPQPPSAHPATPTGEGPSLSALAALSRAIAALDDTAHDAAARALHLARQLRAGVRHASLRLRRAAVRDDTVLALESALDALHDASVEVSDRARAGVQDRLRAALPAFVDGRQETPEEAAEDAYYAQPEHAAESAARSHRPHTRAVPQWPLAVFYMAAVICMGSSATYHLLRVANKSLFQLLARVDYSAIAILIFGESFPTFYYAFHCMPFYQLLYPAISAVACSACIALGLSPRFQSSEWRLVRVGAFVVTALTGVAPMTHMWLASNTQHAEGMYGIAAMGAIYLSGAMMYGFRVPERWFPGRFDLFFASHQIFHWCVYGACIVHALTAVAHYHWRVAHSVCEA